MNVNELIGTYQKEITEITELKNGKYIDDKCLETAVCWIERFVEDLKDLSTIEYSPKPEKVRLPKPIADYLEISKGWDDCYQAYQEDGAISLQNALSFDNFGLFDPLEQWFSVKGNDEIFAEAWIDGYKVEVESKYWAVKTSNDYLKAGKEIVAISNKPKAQEIAELIGNGTSVVPVPSDFLGFCYVDKEVSK